MLWARQNHLQLPDLKYRSPPHRRVSAFYGLISRNSKRQYLAGTGNLSENLLGYPLCPRLFTNQVSSVKYCPNHLFGNALATGHVPAGSGDWVRALYNMEQAPDRFPPLVSTIRLMILLNYRIICS
jgi:hypothetical protein